MAIGQTGKRAQHFGQHCQNQYQLDYGQADNTPLNPPSRRRTPKQEQSSSPSIGTQPSSRPLEVQRSLVQEQPSTRSQSPDLEKSVQRDEITSETQNSGDGGGSLVEDVAERVFKLMLADVKKDRERSGGRFR